MHRLSMKLVVLGSTLALVGCEGGEVPENQTAAAARTLAPPRTAALVFTSDAWSTAPAGREVFAVDRSGAALTRLTFCNDNAAPCDFADIAPAPDRVRLMARR